MTSLAIAIFVTSLLLVVSAVTSASQQRGTTALQKWMFFGGVFGFVWSSARLIAHFLGAQ